MEFTRRDFLKAGAAGIAAASVIGSVPAFAAEAKSSTFEGKKKFAGVGSCRNVTEDIVYIGVSDRRIQLFENVYPIPRGVAYNSYVLLDDKTVLFDTVDRSVTGQFFENLTAVLDGKKLDYLVVNHMEPDHSSAISEVTCALPGGKSRVHTCRSNNPQSVFCVRHFRSFCDSRRRRYLEIRQTHFYVRDGSYGSLAGSHDEL